MVCIKKNRGKEIECKILLVYNLFFVCFVMREKFFYFFFLCVVLYRIYKIKINKF